MAYTLPPTPKDAKRHDEITYKEIVRYRAEIVKILTTNYSKANVLSDYAIEIIRQHADKLTQIAYGKEIEKS